jgi:ABC-type lipoprotein release transport system permease subunit
VLVGRWVWIATVDHIGIVDTPTIPWTAGALIVGGALVGSVAISILPGWLAARRRPAQALRTE